MPRGGAREGAGRPLTGGELRNGRPFLLYKRW